MKINERIFLLIKEIGITKTKFAESLNVGQPFISRICSGDASPSERTIADICRVFNVNPKWLTDGEGEMFLPKTRDQQIADFLSAVMADEPESFRKRLVSALCALDASDWFEIERLAKKITQER